jgi:hypothetical protein
MSSADVNPFLSSYLNGDSPPEPESRSRNTASQPTGNEIDDLFDYDPGIDDVFRDIDTNMDVPATTGKGDRSTGRAGTNNSAGLGIDEEVQITRKKRVNVKLDEKRCECSHIHIFMLWSANIHFSFSPVCYRKLGSRNLGG